MGLNVKNATINNDAIVKRLNVPMETTKYWKSYDEQTAAPEFEAKKHDEFPEELPLVSTLSKAANKKAPRRDFLKMLGFSTAAATIAASCEIPLRKAIPYVVKPENITPGIPTYFASTFINGSDFSSVIVKTREGRPIKVDGNTSCSLTQGGTDSRAQASVVSLYDIARLKNPVSKGEKTNWTQIDKAIKAELARANGDIVLLTASLSSPSTKKALAAMQAKYPGLKVVSYEATSNAGILYANEATFGKKAIPSYHFDKAEVIVGLECAFLNTWLNSTQYATDYAKNRKVTADTKKMSQHFQFESYVSTAGASADYRCTITPSQVGAIALALFNELGGSASSSAQLDEHTAKIVKKAAKALRKAGSNALVVSGSNDKNVQLIVNAINSLLGAYGNTINLDKACQLFQGDDKALAQLVTDMNAGKVGAVMFNNVNPAYDYPQADKFKSALAKVKCKISFNDRLDETGELCDYLTPDNHYLESWGDVEPIKGHLHLIQPTIAPLFQTRSLLESLMAWAEIDGTAHDYIKNNWKEAGVVSTENAWIDALHNGFVVAKSSTEAEADEAPMNEMVFDGSSVASAAAAINQAKTGGVELILIEDATIGNGKYANNPYLQETPDPITKVCWDNVAVVSKKMAKDNGWNDRDIITISANGQSVEVPVTIQPGMKSNVIALSLGYGRTKPGNEHCTVGKNAFPLVQFNGETFVYSLSNVDVKKTGSDYFLAQTQTHHTINQEDIGVLGNKREIINETTFNQYKVDHWSGNKHSELLSTGHYREHHYPTLYPGWDEKLKDGHHWGMSIDLNTCNGCNACVTACNIENNVPIVGQIEVHRAHEMHWMRIDRYYKNDTVNDPDAENPTVTFQPMMCQHCDNAPCENVCPVNATNHSSEGLNQMAYNRCIGTRYCANNCPFKVRRFNWYDYQGTDSFYSETMYDNDEQVMANNLSRMVLNPDVTVRSRGVIEKCSFCVQNIQSAKLEAKKEGRALADGDVKTACQTACPTNAIMFGDVNDENSEINKWNNSERAYRLLEPLHVLSSVSYLTRVRNTDEAIDHDDKVVVDKIEQVKNSHHDHHGDEHGGGHHGHGHDDGHGHSHDKKDKGGHGHH